MTKIMTAMAIRQRLYDYIRLAEDKKVKAMYTMLEGEIESVYDYWKDEEFVAELDRRSAEFKSGEVKGISWNDAKSAINTRVNRKSK